jgi:hypothetical protein
LLCPSVPPGYFRHGNSYYKFYSANSDMAQARQLCLKDQAIEANLATEERANAVMAFACKIQKDKI